jgi:hypothetical protein
VGRAADVGDTGGLAYPVKEVLHSSRGERIAIATHEDVLLRWILGLSVDAEVPPEQCGDRRADADLALPLGEDLAVTRALAVDLVAGIDGQADQLAEPEAGVRHEGDHGVVAEADSLGGVAAVEHCVEVLDGEGLDALLADSGQHPPGGRIALE